MSPGPCQHISQAARVQSRRQVILERRCVWAFQAFATDCSLLADTTEWSPLASHQCMQACRQ